MQSALCFITHIIYYTQVILPCFLNILFVVSSSDSIRDLLQFISLAPEVNMESNFFTPEHGGRVHSIILLTVE